MHKRGEYFFEIITKILKYLSIPNIFTMRIEINEHIVADDEICGGDLTFKNTRILIKDVIGLLGAGVTIEEILRDYFPQITKEAIFASLKLASKNIENEKYVAF